VPESRSPEATAAVGAQLALSVEPLQREVRGVRRLPSGDGGRKRTPLVVDELPDEQAEEKDDQPDGDALSGELRAPGHFTLSAKG